MFFSAGAHPTALLLLLTAATSAPRPAAAILPPAYDGYHLLWHDAFDGDAGSLPDLARWDMITVAPAINDELETYTASPRNVQLSGGGTLQLVPWRDSSAYGGGGWTSGRIESKATVTPAPGQRTRMEVALRLGDGSSQGSSASQQQGIWPAFFLLGDAMRHGTQWPLCGELDILEQVNGANVGYGTAHCGSDSDSDSGGPCDEPAGRGGTVTVGDDDYGAVHTWSLTWDLTSSSWPEQTIAWAVDGQPFFTLTGAQLGDEAAWSTLAHSPFYAIFDVAVGGSFPGDPTSETVDGYSSMLEVFYVAAYST